MSLEQFEIQREERAVSNAHFFCHVCEQEIGSAQPYAAQPYGIYSMRYFCPECVPAKVVHLVGWSSEEAKQIWLNEHLLQLEEAKRP